MAKYCSNCGAEVNGKFCESCGQSVGEENNVNMQSQPKVSPPAYQPQKKKKKHGCLIGIICFFVFCGVIGSIAFQGNSNETSNVETGSNNEKESNVQKNKKEKEEKKDDLELLSYDSVSDEYSRYVVGKVRNNTDRKYTYVQVEISLYKGDSLVGSTLDNVNNLEPGKTWEFKAPILEDESDKFKIANVTGY